MKPRITRYRRAGKNHAVLSVVSKSGTYRRKPCAQCPWRKDVPTGEFPADAFRHSAETAADAALSTFACHMAGSSQTKTCAGFLLSFNAVHNLGVRIAHSTGRIKDDVRSGYPLYRTYREMAEANGVPADDPALKQCRDEGDENTHHSRRRDFGLRREKHRALRRRRGGRSHHHEG